MGALKSCGTPALGECNENIVGVTKILSRIENVTKSNEKLRNHDLKLVFITFPHIPLRSSIFVTPTRKLVTPTLRRGSVAFQNIRACEERPVHRLGGSARAAVTKSEPTSSGQTGVLKFSFALQY